MNKELLIKVLWVIHSCLLNIQLSKSERNYEELSKLADFIEAIENKEGGCEEDESKTNSNKSS